MIISRCCPLQGFSLSSPDVSLNSSSKGVGVDKEVPSWSTRRLHSHAKSGTVVDDVSFDLLSKKLSGLSRSFVGVIIVTTLFFSLWFTILHVVI